MLSIALLAAHGAALLLWSDPGQAFTKMGNAGTKLDLWLIGPSHLYRKDGGFDPEGLLGTLSTTVNVIAGYLATRAIRREVAMPRLGAIGALLVGVALAYAPLMPIAKKLWTGSFVLLTVGIDLLILALLVPLVEARPDRAIVRFFASYGRNPLLIYLFSELLVITLRLVPGDPYAWVGINVFQVIAPGAVGSLLCAVAYALVCWLLGWWLDRRRLIVKL
jgi:predicted acyltransferase